MNNKSAIHKILSKKPACPHPLRGFFKSNDISQIEIFKLLKPRKIKGLHQSTLSKWLSGEKTIPGHIEIELQKLADKISEAKKN